MGFTPLFSPVHPSPAQEPVRGGAGLGFGAPGSPASPTGPAAERGSGRRLREPPAASGQVGAGGGGGAAPPGRPCRGATGPRPPRRRPRIPRNGRWHRPAGAALRRAHGDTRARTRHAHGRAWLKAGEKWLAVTAQPVSHGGGEGLRSPSSPRVRGRGSAPLHSCPLLAWTGVAARSAGWEGCPLPGSGPQRCRRRGGRAGGCCWRCRASLLPAACFPSAN